jgi:uncharacterized membrane protein YjjP (DUF1212 family)
VSTASRAVSSEGDGESADAGAAYDSIARAAAMLHSNGQTTSVTLTAVERLDSGYGVRTTLIPSWASLQLTGGAEGDCPLRTIAAQPTNVNMRRVAAAMRAIDRAEDGPLVPAVVDRELDQAARLPASSVFVFALACATGASALGVIFGVTRPWAFVLIAVSAAAGGFVRRGMGRVGFGLYSQAFIGATIAGVVGALAVSMDLSSAARLVAVCPAMVIVPGPHVLNGALDLGGRRISLGIARLGFATLILLAIGAGLILGLHLGGTDLPVESTGHIVPLYADMIAAGVASASYPVYFSMPYRIIYWPVLIGMFAHGVRWVALYVWHLDIATSALIACLIVGFALVPVATRLRLPFAAIGFAAVVNLVPGVYVFRMLSGLIQALDGTGTPQVLTAAFTDGLTAFLVVLGMTIGLVIPMQLLGRLRVLSAKRHER